MLHSLLTLYVTLTANTLYVTLTANTLYVTLTANTLYVTLTANTLYVTLSALGTSVDNSSEWETCDKLREADKELLKYIKVKHIFDMMVEHKKVKFGVR